MQNSIIPDRPDRPNRANRPVPAPELVLPQGLEFEATAAVVSAKLEELAYRSDEKTRVVATFVGLTAVWVAFLVFLVVAAL